MSTEDKNDAGLEGTGHHTTLSMEAGTLSAFSSEHVDRYVGARIDWRRKELGLTQQELADLIGVTNQQVYNYMHAIHRLGAGRLYDIAQILHVTPKYFFEGIESGLMPEPIVNESTFALLQIVKRIERDEERKWVNETAKKAPRPKPG